MITKLFTGFVGCFVCLLFCSCLSSATSTRTDEVAANRIELLHEEIGNLRRDIKLLNKDVRQVLVDVRIIKASRLSSPRVLAAQPAPRAAPPVDSVVYDINIGSSPVMGPKDAPVTIVEFSDFECVYCAREYPTIKQVLEAYPGKIRFVFKHFPLRIHKKAKPAHVAAEYALREGGNDAFWFVHDKMINNPLKIDLPDLRGYLKELELDLTGFDQIVASPSAISDYLRADFIEASKCQVQGTPTILINGVKLANRNFYGY
ncbi:MAG: thioredoxin domain-containing protein, partial [Planctomycetes bacterium]|nr:thioredoxin domain-containing protein [Planctomycetota bacterium]